MNEPGKNKRHKGRLGEKTALLVWILIFILPGLIFPKNSFIPGPMQILDRLVKIVGTGDFLSRTLYTATNVLSGFFIGSLSALVLGRLSAKSQSLENFLKVPLSLIKSVPVASFIILSLFWFPLRGVSIFVVFLIVFPVVYGHALSAWKGLDPAMKEVSQVFALKPFMYLRAIVMDQIQDALAAGLRTGLGMAWKAGVAAEVISMAGKSIGGAIYDSKVYLEMADLFAWTLWLVVMSAASEKLLTILWKKLQATLAAIPANANCSGCPEGPEEPEKMSKLGVTGGVKVDHGFAEVNGKPAGSGDSGRLDDHGKAGADVRQVDHGKAAPSRKPIITLEKISLSYSDKPVLKNLSLEVFAGDRLAVIGRSGAGKTSFIRIIAGLEASFSGKVKWPSEDPGGKSSKPSISMQFQEDRLIENAGIVENLRLVGCSDSDIRAVANALDLEGFGDGPVKGMSGGMKRRLSLIRAVLRPTDLVVLDEPTAGMDEKTAAKAMAWAAKEIGRRHLACIIVSHDLDGIKGFNINRHIEILPLGQAIVRA